jgi:hypothetical protein
LLEFAMIAKMNGDDLTPKQSRPVPVAALMCPILAALFFGAAPSIGLAVPLDPQRSFEVADCAAAMVRLEEALIGSPLISPTENGEVVTNALIWADRFCTPDDVQNLIQKFEPAK